MKNCKVCGVAGYLVFDKIILADKGADCEIGGVSNGVYKTLGLKSPLM